MEISIINGSPRKNGATALILQKIEEQLRLHEDVKINYFNLGELSAGFLQ